MGKLNSHTYREEYVTTLRRLIDYAVARYGKLTANELLDGDQKYTYGQLNDAVAQLSVRMSRFGIGAGDRVAIYSQNMPNWAVAFFATTAYSRVVVPILAESSPKDVETILTHSETKVLFVSKAKLQSVPEKCLEQMTMVIQLDDLTVVRAEEKNFTGIGFVREPQPDDLAGLFYTSGTTGNPKGVMLSHRNLCANAQTAYYTQRFRTGTRWLSVLPMAHTYEMAFSFLYPIYGGGHVYYLKRAASASVLMGAMKRIRPHVVCAVPLILDKIYRGNVRKTIEQSKALTWMEQHMPGMLYRMIGRKMKKFFGGKLMFFGLGGAKLDPTVEAFLIKARFPYAIGYGLTETAPLICSKRVGEGHCNSIGQATHGVMVRLGDRDPETGEGEIQCIGPNVMLGYYKDLERTRKAFTDDGWFRTGDLATEKDGWYSICGRIGSLIVGPSGENIYPEDIEDLINNGVAGVNESLVVQDHGTLVALVKLDDKVLDWDSEKEEQFYANIEAKKAEILAFVNKNVRQSNRIKEVRIVEDNFVRTATMKIKRFLYKDGNMPSKEETAEKK